MNARNSAALIAFLLLSFAAVLVSAQTSSGTSVKVTLGLGDETGHDWSGSLRVDSGEIVDLQPWGFETRHKLDAERSSWTCDSAVQVARGKTRFAEPQRGVLVGYRGPLSARLTVDTKQGSFTCRFSDLQFGETTTVLEGRAQLQLAMSPRAVAASAYSPSLFNSLNLSLHSID